MDRPSSITPWDLECMLCDETAEPKALPLSLLEEITDGFSDARQIGSSGFAVVYKGMLENRIVAMKRMSDAYMDEMVFQREIECLMMATHKNVVRFLGYCANTHGSMERYDGKLVMADVNQKLLCFEYLPKGGLHEYITDTSSGLWWSDRYQIIMGICQGLHYFHQKSIVHLDLKPANILLDDNWLPKITDFGLSRCFDEMKSRAISKIVGTIGYLAPESFNHTEVTYRHSYRLDIYSLGVVITEILTGEKGYHDIEEVVEIWSKSLEKLESKVQLEQVRVCAEIGIECTNFDPAKRPDTQHIIDRLHETESMDEYIEIGTSTAHQVLSLLILRACILDFGTAKISEFNFCDLINLRNVFCSPDVKFANISGLTSLQALPCAFSVRNKKGYELKQLKDINKLGGKLLINGLENVTSMEEAVEANLAAKEQLTNLILWWDDDANGSCPREAQEEVLEGLCPPVGLQALHIMHYTGWSYLDWMVGTENGGPKDLQILHISAFSLLGGPAPELVFPHLRSLEFVACQWEALP
ncbi:unnamed protein product [Alopecurus aequalis]